MAILRQRGAPTWELDPDARRGMKEAVRNGQPRLALEYAETLIDAQQQDIESLRGSIEELQAQVRDLTRLATTEPKRGPGRPPKTEPEDTAAPAE
jgi:hypothetical protein